ncbi:YbaB/EbfC family nucleoid-associated protein [Actinoplanes sp. NBRC 103695]|uniref:YbaB/EbfC family nucleoid-associated protein n=1 Tax=Actinoplanes sp. NBRC 103695 TaxID=3032202 RepID=UPI0024A455F2|nr:YbaB/EbfC family nucleoid-associated protein [Actinoplanes sp. NBRC 103695]GLY97192.1 nucleoid-associated protein [Actinoplanes sp. NBRC 103695]
MTQPDLNRAMSMAMSMQDQVSAIRDKMAEIELIGSAAGGAVKVRVTATGEYRSVRIDPEVYDYGREAVQDAVLAALQDIARQLKEITERRANDMQDIFDDVTKGLLSGN